LENFKYLLDNDIFVSAVNFITKNNKGYINSYHSNEHLLSVFYSTQDLANYEELDDHSRLVLGVAALFHDFNHNGKIGDDSVNIKEAIKGLLNFNSTIDDELDDELDLIISLIEVTEFPARPNPKTIEEKIMMDSDMLSTYNENWFTTIIIGLSKEFNVTIKQQIENQIKFIKNLKYFTEYAQNIHSNNKAKLIKNLNELNEIW
jgi:hypothetical protein